MGSCNRLSCLGQVIHPATTQVCRLAMLTLLAVFKDLIPAYRIRPAMEEVPEQVSGELGQRQSLELTQLAIPQLFSEVVPLTTPITQLSKEVRALRSHEAALLDSYHAYLKALLRVSCTAVGGTCHATWLQPLPKLCNSGMHLRLQLWHAPPWQISMHVCCPCAAGVQRQQCWPCPNTAGPCGR